MASAFDHAAHSRRHAESVLVEVDLADGTKGWGGGAPRGYVTGETLAVDFDVLLSGDLIEFLDRIDWLSFDAAVASIADLDLPKCLTAPAAACAAEIALLDAACREFGRPLSDVLPLAVPD